MHGMAVAPELGRGFTSNGRAGTSTIFDLKTQKVLGSVNTGKNPDAIAYEPVTKRVFTFNGASNDATAFGAADGTLPEPSRSRENLNLLPRTAPAKFLSTSKAHRSWWKSMRRH